MTTGDIIAELRTDKGMTQEDLSNILHVSRSTVSNWEINNSKIDTITLVKIADLFNVSCDYLLCRTKYKYNFALENKENAEAIMEVYKSLKKFNIKKK